MPSRPQLTRLMLVVGVSLWLHSLLGAPVNSGDGAVYLHQAQLGLLELRTVHWGYLVPLSLMEGWAQTLGLSSGVGAQVLSLLSAVALSVALVRLGGVNRLGSLVPLALVFAHPLTLTEIGRVEVYLPQLAVGLWSLERWICAPRGPVSAGRALGAGALAAWAVLISPTTAVALPGLWLARGRGRSWGVMGAAAAALWCVCMGPHLADFFWGPRGLLLSLGGGLSLGRGAVEMLKAVGPEWGLAAPVAGYAVSRAGRRAVGVVLATLALAALANRYPDVPLALIVVGVVAAAIAKAEPWDLRSPALGLVFALCLVGQIIVADTSARHQLRAQGRWQARAQALEALMGPEDLALGSWGDARRLAFALDGDPESPRFVVAGQRLDDLERCLAREGRIWPIPLGAAPPEPASLGLSGVGQLSYVLSDAGPLVYWSRGGAQPPL